jgi:hypothetical protein
MQRTCILTNLFETLITLEELNLISEDDLVCVLDHKLKNKEKKKAKKKFMLKNLFISSTEGEIPTENNSEEKN